MNVQGPVPHLARVLPAAAPAPARPAAAPARSERTAGAADTPAAGAQASFWDLLTPEEREFFAQQSALGPVTYGPRSTCRAPQPGPVGQRVDVKG